MAEASQVGVTSEQTWQTEMRIYRTFVILAKQAKAGRIPSFRIGTCVRFDPVVVAKWLRTQ